jgi:hypothetical protein
MPSCTVQLYNLLPCLWLLIRCYEYLLHIPFLCMHTVNIWCYHCTSRVPSKCFALERKRLIFFYLVVLTDIRVHVLISICFLVFQTLCTVQKHILQGGPKGLNFTVPSLVFSALKVCSKTLRKWYDFSSEHSKFHNFFMHNVQFSAFKVCSKTLRKWYDFRT